MTTMRPKQTGSRWGIPAALVLAALLSACQSAPPPSPQPTAPAATTPSAATAVATRAPAAATPAAAKAAPAATVDACALLTADEVQAAVGEAVAPRQEPTGDARASGCSYFGTASNTRVASTAVYAVTPGEAKGIHEATKGGGRDQAAVAGVGEDAYWDNDFRSLDVLQGRYAVGLTVPTSDKAGALNAAKTLAPKLLGRLP